MSALARLNEEAREELSALSDYDGSINELIRRLEELKKRVGGGTLIYFDAGYNNVEVHIGKR